MTDNSYLNTQKRINKKKKQKTEKTKPNYKKKQEVIEKGIDVKIRKLQKYAFATRDNPEVNSTIWDQIREYRDDIGFESWVEGNRVNRAFYARKTRLKQYIAAMLCSEYEVTFLTLTFRDDVLYETSADTRKQYVRRFLKDSADYYIANIDFGDENGREHYHAVICGRVNFKKWIYGNCAGSKCRRDMSSAAAMSTYVCKLTNHAIKETTGGHHVIYSRNMRKLVDGLADGSIKLFGSEA